MRLLFASPLGPADPTGWGAFGGYAVHLHAGSWKGATELNATRLLDRAMRHAEGGRHELAGDLLKRLVIHAAGALGGEALQVGWPQRSMSP